MRFPILFVIACFWIALASARADPIVTIPGTNSQSDLAAAQARLRVAPGFKVELWASEPLIQNPTSLSFDEHGRAYVVESHRRRTSVFDVRNFKEWVPDDLALSTVEQRAGFLRGKLATNQAFVDAATKSTRGGFRDLNGDEVIDSRDLEVESERIRLVWDDDHDGRADRALTFADGFKTSVSGVAAGVLVHGSNVWFTCIPDLWRFTVSDPEFQRGDIPASWLTNSSRLPSGIHQECLLSGFGVHVAFGGHDLHGLIKGPDGRLYFSVADRGANVLSTKNRGAATPFDDVRDTGAIFRCEPDGSNFEVFARGLRNPQELAFDEFGNLWTGDNNGDGGDKARWTLVLEGADYGWTIGWQWLPKMGAWNSERLWHTQESNTAAYVVPPVAHVGHGPAGIAYYPGTGLGDAFAATFFYCDFPGGLRTFRVEPVGAFFRVVAAPNSENSATWMEDNSTTNFIGKLLWNLTPVDVAFPPGGGVMVADGFPTWEKDGKGRLWRVLDPSLASDPLIAETRRLLAEGMSQRNNSDLARLLGHTDMRVRLDAQWELASREEAAWQTLSTVAINSREPRARRHAIWGLSQILRGPIANEDQLIRRFQDLLSLLDDADPHVQSAVARMFGTARFADAQAKLTELVKSSPAPVMAQTLMAYRDLALAISGQPNFGRQSSWPDPRRGSLPPLLRSKVPDSSSGMRLHWPIAEALQRLDGDASEDPVLRHAMVELIVSIARPGPTKAYDNPFAEWKSHTNPSVRLFWLLAQRRYADPRIAEFLTDLHPQLVLEAARAINDVPIPDAMPALAALLPTIGDHNLQTKEFPWPSDVNFTRDEWLTFVLRRAVNAALRLGTPTNAMALAVTAARSDLPESVRAEALEALGSWAQPPRIDRIVGLHRPVPTRSSKPAQDALAEIWPRVADASGTNLLFAAIRAGASLKPNRWPDQLLALRNHSDPAVRTEVARITSESSPAFARELFALTESGPLSQRQSALRSLAESSDPLAPSLINEQMNRLAQGTLPSELQLDVLEAARAFQTAQPDLGVALQRWTNSLPANDLLAQYRVTLAGGDAANGRKLFAERADWGCQRCHKLNGEGGEVGPELNGLGKTKGAEFVLRAILDPSAEIAAGFENLLVTRKDGTVVVGVVKSDTAESLVLETPEDGRITIPADQVTARDHGISAMPEGLVDLMTLRELRDLMAALASDL